MGCGSSQPVECQECKAREGDAARKPEKGTKKAAPKEETKVEGKYKVTHSDNNEGDAEATTKEAPSAPPEELKAPSKADPEAAEDKQKSSGLTVGKSTEVESIGVMSFDDPESPHPEKIKYDSQKPGKQAPPDTAVPVPLPDPVICVVEPMDGDAEKSTKDNGSGIAGDFVALLYEKAEDMARFVNKHGLDDAKIAQAVAAKFEQLLPKPFHEAFGNAFAGAVESFGGFDLGPRHDSLGMKKTPGLKKRGSFKPKIVTTAKGHGNHAEVNSEGTSVLSSDSVSNGSHASNVSRVLEDLGRIGSVGAAGLGRVGTAGPTSPKNNGPASPRSPARKPHTTPANNNGKGGLRRQEPDMDALLLQLLISAGSLIKYTTQLTDKAAFISSVAEHVNELIQSDSCTIYELEMENEKEVLRTVLDTGTGCSFCSLDSAMSGAEFDSVDLYVANLDAADPLRYVVRNVEHVHAAPHDTAWKPSHTEKYAVYEALYHPIVHDEKLLGICKVAKQDSDDPEAMFKSGGALKDLVGSVLVFVGAVMSAFSMGSALKTAADRSMALLMTIQDMQSVDISDFNLTARKIMEHAQQLVKCETVEVYLVNKEQGTLRDMSKKHRDPVAINATLPGVCVTSGEILNIPDMAKFGHDVVADPLFLGRQKIASYLSVPIKTLDNDVLGVFQLINKYKDAGDYDDDFSPDDIHSMEIFTSFASMCLRTASLIEFLRQSSQQSSILMNRIAGGGQMTTTSKIKQTSAMWQKLQDHEIIKVLAMDILPEESERLNTMGFPIETYYLGKQDSSRLPSLIVHMFEANGRNSAKTFGTSAERLVTFILEVRKKYRIIPYHNFTHAFDVLQGVFHFLNMLPKGKYLTEVDEFVLLVSALCHDIDHAGLNNGFHLKAETPLGVLHSASGTKSVMEVHHCNLTIDILSNPETNVFEGLGGEETRHAYRAVIECILGTDLTRHQEIMDTFVESMADYDINQQPHKRVFMTIILKAADISNIARPFDISKSWGKRVTKEFKQQPVGTENEVSGASLTMKRKESFSVVREDAETRETLRELCKTQLSFINGLGLNMYNVVGEKIPELKFLSEHVLENKQKWEELEGLITSGRH
eukprot:TRINITY_DN4951_c0_g1_i1.p1 TRINITY_DN4951_c0_g1~~TRINITY_DN4951_c0_g1_i1.p1  ORF type:complete len:1103 (+),score=408.59 TRINITY_DN4951_c0_g1_i1:198-3506(+)